MDSTNFTTLPDLIQTIILIVKFGTMVGLYSLIVIGIVRTLTRSK